MLSSTFAGHRTYCGSWFSPTLLWIPRIKTQVIRLGGRLSLFSELPCVPFCFQEAVGIYLSSLKNCFLSLLWWVCEAKMTGDSMLSSLSQWLFTDNNMNNVGPRRRKRRGASFLMEDAEWEVYMCNNADSPLPLWREVLPKDELVQKKKCNSERWQGRKVTD